MSDNHIKILFIGDIVARPGREAVAELLPQLRTELDLDLVIANAENISGGRGVTADSLYEMQGAGVDVFTSGNHVFGIDDWEDVLDDPGFQLIRPMNYIGDIPGHGTLSITIHEKVVTIGNIQGSINMPTPVDNPFHTIDSFLATTTADIYVVDFHAEVTSEKRAMGFYLNGRVDALVGTHTHVPTCDHQILSEGTAYVTDLGMCGNKDSVLGVKPETVITRFTSSVGSRFDWRYKGSKVFNSTLLTYRNGKVADFSRVDRILS